MHNLHPITPRGKSAPETITHGAVELIDVTDTALISVTARQGYEEKVTKLLSEYISGDTPGAGMSCIGKSHTAFWMGPDQWMIEAKIDPNVDPTKDIALHFSEIASITEQTDGWCRFDLQGDHLISVFERLCSANVAAMTGTEAARTSIEHLGCFVIRRSASHFSVIGPRSAADSLHHALLTAMKSAL